MDEYDKKFAEMQKYIPFLEAMIERLQNVKDKSREVQLQKMQSLHGILSNSKRKYVSQVQRTRKPLVIRLCLPLPSNVYAGVQPPEFPILLNIQ